MVVPSSPGSMLPMGNRIRRRFKRMEPQGGAVNLSNKRLSARHGKSLSQAMRSVGERLQILDLSGNELGLQGVLQVVQRLRRCPKLWHLDVQGNALSAEDEKVVARTLAQEPPLGLTSLAGIDLRDHLDAMRVPDTLATETNEAILRFLAVPARVRCAFRNVAATGTADLRFLGLWPDHGAVVADEMAAAGDKLEILDLSFNHLGPKGAQHVARAMLHCPNLKELHLDATAVGPAGAHDVVEASHQCPLLIVLHLGQNSLGADGEREVLRLLVERPHPALERLEGLELRQSVKAVGLPPDFAERNNKDLLERLRSILPKPPAHARERAKMDGAEGDSKEGGLGAERRPSAASSKVDGYDMDGTPLTSAATTRPSTPTLASSSPAPSASNSVGNQATMAPPSPPTATLTPGDAAPRDASPAPTAAMSTPNRLAKLPEGEELATPKHPSAWKRMFGRRDSFDESAGDATAVSTPPPLRTATSSLSSVGSAASFEGVVADDAQADEIRRNFREAGEEGKVRLAPEELDPQHSRVIRDEMIKSGPRLKVMYLRGRALTPTSIRHVAAGLRHCPKVKTLWLDDSNIGDAGANAVAGVIGCCSELKMLWLVNNGIGDTGILELVRASYHCQNLKFLNLSDNAITEEGEEAAARMLAATPHPTLAHLEGIDLRYHLEAMGLPLELENYDNQTILTWLRDQDRMQRA